ncbi:MAG: phosphatidylinositol-specific phospholipase C domain-containing protein [Clostridia bacterium]|nr:phosphatidylinositol-specific phospholipase C domain-containing protein [Clostridia bacterium]
MKLGGKIALIVVSCVLVAILAIGLGLGLNAKKAIDDTEATPFLSEWMSYIRDDVKIKNVVIPGSHDAATKDMNWMAETQNRTIGEQLACGSRYLDLRVWEKGDSYYVFHGPIKGCDFLPIVDEIKAFLDAHPTEFLVLDMQKFKGDSQNDVISILSSKLRDKIVKNTTSSADIDFVDNLTVADVRGKCLVFWGDPETVANGDYLFLRDHNDGRREDAVLRSFYSRKYNTLSSASYIKKGLTTYLAQHKEKPLGLFVLQGQLTDPVFVVGPKAIEALHNANMSEYIKNFDTENNQINIIMRDFIGPKKCAEILALNTRYNNVKETLAEEFSNEFSKLF